ncbi:MAG: beta-galactosidase [Sedimentisphaerales bacterium]|nr:beta-galactosidase [Sedimentisphaerales bacterium]
MSIQQGVFGLHANELPAGLILGFTGLFLFCVESSAQGADCYRFKVPGSVSLPRSGHLVIGPSSPDGPVWGVNSRYMTMDEKPFMPVMGEFHFSRYPADEWEVELLKMKAGGINIVPTYLFWNHHEEIEGEFDFTGCRDIRRFIELCHKHGLWVWVRIGPWCHGEVRNGGFPEWLREPFNIKADEHLGWANNGLRSNDPAYLKLVERLYGRYADECRGLMAKDGGPIIGVQVENEYSSGGKGKGAEHIAKLIEIAQKAGFEVPYYSVTGWHNAPFPPDRCIPMFGGYPSAPWAGNTKKLEPQQVYRFDLKRDDGAIGTDIYKPSDYSKRDLTPYPLMTCEVGLGNQITDCRRPLIGTPDGVVPAMTRLGIGAAGIGYYVYHGGTNPEGKLTTLQESKATAYPNDCPVKSYDFQTAIREFGQIDPKYHYVKLMHMFMYNFEDMLAPMVPLLPDKFAKSNDDFGPARMALRTNGKSGFLFVNNHVRLYPQPDRKDVQIIFDSDGSKLCVPEKPVDIPAGANFIWPINLDMEGAVLRYATAQPMCRLEDEQGDVYVFFQTITKVPEYVFEPGSIDGSTSQITVKKPGLKALNKIVTKAGKTVRILTLTHKQALQSYQWEHGGKSRLVISEADAYFESDRIHFLSRKPSGRVWIMPAADLKGQGVKSGKAVGEFSVHKISFSSGKPKPKVSKFSVGENEWRIKPEHLQSGAYLQIKYTGDTAELYVGEKLVADNFYNGEVFEVKLDRWAEELKEKELILKIAPLKPEKKVYLDVPRPKEKPSLKSVTIETEKQAKATIS